MASHAERPSRAAIVATAGETIAGGSKSFAAASRLFDRPTRERAWLLYAWARACDDLADGQDLGHGMTAVADAPERLARIAAGTEAALAGEWVGDPAFDALRLVAAEARLPHALVRDVVAGFALDAEDWRPRSEDNLYRYCYHVAGAIGCLMAVVMGVDPADEDTLDRACDLGIAFQLSNIARDLCEDAAAERCYLPIEWLVEMDVPPGEHMKPPFRHRITVLARRLVDTAERYEASAREGTPALPFRAAWAVLAAADIYGGIGRAVVARGEHAWDHRVTTSKGQKLAAIGRALVAAQARATRYPRTARDPDLWTRPRHG
ncbi:phytoene/squalene synthase family protein [Sphingomonas sp. ac-8]|uniref:phytoene/squalene synthase family protein n=1 Tax=Sphingomonas sp. ac-8 TaxID=3242977 RepID=UPI003A80B771